MKFSPDQVRRTAKALFKDDDSAEATVKALEFLEACTVQNDEPPAKASLETNSSSAELIERLAQVVTSKQVNITAAAKAIGVHPMTLRTWIQHDNSPRPDRLEKIRQFLAELDL